MREVSKCSISGVSFVLDEDAYCLLEKYLRSIERVYGESRDGREIVADIEARIAELILSRQENTQVVDIRLLQEIIDQLGTAQSITDELDASSTTVSNAEEPRIPRRLYRDMENARIGGVCAGLARYFDCDATWVRLFLFLPLVIDILMAPLPGLSRWLPSFSHIFGMFILGYLIMWFAVPRARTARQKLEMDGERITVNAIRNRTVSSNEANNEVKSVVAQVVYVLGQLALLFIKLCIGIFIFVLVAGICTLIVWLIIWACTSDVTSLIWGISDVVSHVKLLGILGAISILIPLLLLVYILLCLLTSHKPSAKGSIVGFLIWFLFLLMTIGFTISNINLDKTNGIPHLFYEPEKSLSENEKDATDNVLWQEADTTQIVVTDTLYTSNRKDTNR
jgi:phage shock protein PspC (stress-responsive transcriptional regulator)